MADSQIHVALAGNPNCGKTTLFNALTGSNQYVGNWPGVTVEKKEGRLKGRKDIVIQDLPGIYSLSPYTLEEVVARNYLVKEKPDAILNIVDGTNIERNLYLTTQLIELGLPVVVAVNMMDLVRRNGDQIDARKLSDALGCQVLEMSALKGEGGMAAATYGAKIMKELGLIPDGYRIMVVGSVQEEDCDGMCWQYIVNKDFQGQEDARSKIEFVVSTEPTDGGIYRGHRGRMEIRVDVHGVSCHGSAPERGDNAIYKMADILQDVRALNESGDGPSNRVKGLVKMLNPEFNPEHYEDAQFLGRGTCTVSQIFYTSPSRCAVADSCAISIDRRMTAGETWDSCLQEIRDLPSVKKYGDDVKVSMYMYDRPSWTGEVYETECYFPTWINKESAAHVQALVDAHHALWGDERIGYADADQARDAMHLRTGRPLTDKWTFSTNGVAIQGRYGIPCVGFGPGAESQAHAPNEITWKMDLVTCAALYAAVPGNYKEENKTADVSQFRAGKTDNDIQ